MKLLLLLALAVAIGCAPQPTLEELEDEASKTGDWETVERHEEVMKKRLESSGPGCTDGLNKYCIEELSGIECYCIPETIIRE